MRGAHSFVTNAFRSHVATPSYCTHHLTCNSGLNDAFVLLYISAIVCSHDWFKEKNAQFSVSFLYSEMV